MPHNNASPPPDEITGKLNQLPLAKIKRIIRQDEDITTCSTNAVFAITIATEMFVQYLAQQGHNIVKTERKPRRNIQYKDLANAVFRVDNLEFLSDVIPRTMTFKEYKEKKSTKSAQRRQQRLGQTTLDEGILGEGELEEEEEEEGSESRDMDGLNGGEVENDGPSRSIAVVMPFRGTGPDSAPLFPNESDMDVTMEN